MAAGQRNRRELQFWVLQLVGWSTWVLLLVVRDLTFIPAEYMFDRAMVFTLDAMVGLVFTSGLRYLYRASWDAPAWLRILVVLVGCLVASLAWQPIKRLIVATEFGANVELMGYGWAPFVNILLPFTFSLLLVWSVFYFCIKYYQLFQVEKEKFLRSEALAHEAQLRMLRYQLNPHFLFNTLNAISTLVMQGSSDTANRMLTKLSKFLRYSLDHDPLDEVDLEQELRSVQLYLDIEKVRFEERMRIEIDVSEEARKALVPSMLLQPLIENSVKYAIARSEDGGCIRITGKVLGDQLELCVIDDGPGPENGHEEATVASSGVGLQNVRNRLQELYDSRHRLELTRLQPRGFTVTVTIPYQTSANTG